MCLLQLKLFQTDKKIYCIKKLKNTFRNTLKNCHYSLKILWETLMNDF